MLVWESKGLFLRPWLSIYYLPLWPQFYHVNKEKYALHDLFFCQNSANVFFLLIFSSRGKDIIVFFIFIYFSPLPKQFHKLLENFGKHRKEKNPYSLHSILACPFHSFLYSLIKMNIHSFLYFYTAVRKQKQQKGDSPFQILETLPCRKRHQTCSVQNQGISEKKQHQFCLITGKNVPFLCP